MDAAQGFQIGISIVMFALLLVYAVRRVRAKALARDATAVQATVVGTVRREGGRAYKAYVDTTFEVPGRGLLTHCQGCESEGKAILWSRLHKEGSVHWVVPDEIHAGEVFLRRDLARHDWPLIAMVTAVGLTTAYALYLFAMEYWDHE